MSQTRVVIALLFALTACGDDKTEQRTPGTTPGGDSPPTAVTLPPGNTAFDYQLGGAYVPATGVGIVSRDRTASPAAGLYNICYVNGFQAQEEELTWWETNHPDLLLRNNGALVIDEDWNEALLDITSADKRAALTDVVGDWISGCAAGGYDAVELDNLDTYTRSDGLITRDDAIAMMRAFADTAHAAYMAVAQKNSAEIVDARAAMATDFVVAEECARYEECSVYSDAYDNHVLDIEYRRGDFDSACGAAHAYPVILRDRNLTMPGDDAYVYDRC